MFLDNWIKNKPVTVMIIMAVFVHVTRSSDLVIGLLLYVFVLTLKNFKTKKILRALSISFIIFAIFSGIINVLTLMSSLNILPMTRTNTLALFIYSIGASGIMIITIAMIIVYLVLENKENYNKLFLIALIAPIIGTIIYVSESFLLNAIYNYFLNVNNTNGFATGSITIGNSPLFSLIQLLILVYLILKSREEQNLI